MDWRALESKRSFGWRRFNRDLLPGFACASGSFMRNYDVRSIV
jgi:hypothetical protein